MINENDLTVDQVRTVFEWLDEQGYDPSIDNHEQLLREWVIADHEDPDDSPVIHWPAVLPTLNRKAPKVGQAIVVNLSGKLTHAIYLGLSIGDSLGGLKQHRIKTADQPVRSVDGLSKWKPLIFVPIGLAQPIDHQLISLPDPDSPHSKRWLYRFFEGNHVALGSPHELKAVERWSSYPTPKESDLWGSE